MNAKEEKKPIARKQGSDVINDPAIFLHSKHENSTKTHENDVFSGLRTAFRLLFAGGRTILSEFYSVYKIL